MKSAAWRFLGVGIISTGAIIIDEKTGIGLGTIAMFGVGILWLARKLQALEDFTVESKEWRKIVLDEQGVARLEREEILRHQEIARQRQEMIISQLATIDETKKVYGELLLRLDAMKIQIGDKHK